MEKKDAFKMSFTYTLEEGASNQQDWTGPILAIYMDPVSPVGPNRNPPHSKLYIIHSNVLFPPTSYLKLPPLIRRTSFPEVE